MLSGQVWLDCPQKKCTQGGSNPTKWTRFINSISSSDEKCQGLQYHIQKIEKTVAPCSDPHSSTLAFFLLQKAIVLECLLSAYGWMMARRPPPTRCSPIDLQYMMLFGGRDKLFVFYWFCYKIELTFIIPFTVIKYTGDWVTFIRYQKTRLRRSLKCVLCNNEILGSLHWD